MQRPDELSGGMRRRLLIARAWLHQPRILLLDEPTTGLDPQARLLVWDRLSDLKAQGVTFLLTTHYMEEAAYLCDRLVVMDQGRILVEGTPEELILQHVGAQVLEVRLRPGEKAQLMELLQDSASRTWRTGVTRYCCTATAVGWPRRMECCGSTSSPSDRATWRTCSCA